MPMSFAGRAANSSGFAIRPRGLEIGLSGFAASNRPSSPTVSYAMATAEHREPCESRGSCTVLGARGGEIPPRDSTTTAVIRPLSQGRLYLSNPTLVVSVGTSRSCQLPTHEMQAKLSLDHFVGPLLKKPRHV